MVNSNDEEAGQTTPLLHEGSTVYTEGNLNMDGQGFKIIIGAKLFRRKDFILMKQMIMSTLK